MQKLDLSSLNKISQGDEKVIIQFLELFTANTPKDISGLKRAIEEENGKSVHYYVHKLKSTTQSIGYLNGHKELQKIEDKLLLSHPIPPLRKELLAVTRECENAVVEARAMLEKFVK